MSAPLFLGIDLGTSSLKLQVIDLNAEPVANASASIEMSVPRPGWAEQDPADWWGALAGACRKLFAGGAVQASSIAAIGMTGQMHGAVFLDAGREVLRPCLIWADGRTTEQVEMIKRAVPVDELIRITGNAPNTGFTATRVMWVQQHEPEIYARTRSILLPKDYLRYRLVGTLDTDVSDASATLMFDLGKRDWSVDLLRAFHIEPNLLPRVRESGDVAGQVTAAAAMFTGLPEGAPVVVGGGDAECGALGLGLVGSEQDRDILLSNIGTAGQLFAVTERPLIDPKGRVHSLCHVTEGRWHVMAAILAGGVALRWLLDVMVPAGGSPDGYDKIAAEAARVAPGSEGVIFLPYLLGERTPHMDTDASAGFFGLRLHHTHAHMARAVMEGVAFALRDGLQVMREMGIASREVRLAGGGARLEVWRAIQRDVFNLPVRVTPAAHSAAYGAALLAGVGAHAFPRVSDALQGEPPGELSEPDPAAAAEYEIVYRRYRQLYPALRGI